MNDMEQNIERSIRIFLASLKSEKTRLEYLKSLEKFKKHFQIDSFTEYLKKDPKDIQLDLEDYLLWMRENVFTNSIPTYYHPIQTFLEMNDVMINFKKLRRLFPERAKTAVERGWTTEEIQKMLKVSDNLRITAVIHFENASGGRLGLCDGLLIKHLVPIQDASYGKCYAITGYADSKEEYLTFLTPEATKALDDYLDLRRAKGETITSESPVFSKERRTSKTESAQSSSLGGSIMELQKKAGLRNPKNKKHGRFAVQANHGFRHRFNEIVKSSNLINPHVAERLLSHSSKMLPLDSIYYHPDLDTMWKEYKKVIPLITIDPTERLLLDKQNLESEVTELSKIKENTKIQALEIEKLTKMVELIQKTREITS